MVDPVTSRRWICRGLFVLLAFACLFLQVLPVTVEAGGWPGPDLILATALVWGLRRPDYVPPLLLGGVGLISDLILQRPPGLHAALVVLAIEVVRARRALWRDLPFLAEWAVASVLAAAVILLHWLGLAVFMVDQAAVGLHLIELIATVLAYPAVVAASVWIFGVRRPAPGSTDAWRQGL